MLNNNRIYGKELSRAFVEYSETCLKGQLKID